MWFCAGVPQSLAFVCEYEYVVVVLTMMKRTTSYYYCTLDTVNHLPYLCPAVLIDPLFPECNCIQLS